MKLDIYRQKWLDLVFEGRNKEYGAYELRKKNPKVTMLALLIGGVGFMLAVGIPGWLPDGKDKEEEEKVTMVDMAKLAPPPPDKPLVPPPPPPPPAPKIDEVKFVKPKVVKKEEVVEEIKTIEELKDKNVGAKDVKGQDDGRIVIEEPSGDGPADSKVVEDETVYRSVQVNPEPEGGLKKFYQFVANNFQTSGEEEEGTVIKVLVSFVVEKDGSLTDIKILRDPGNGYGKEAMRVLKKAPRWKPGINNGKAVRVAFNLPITIQAGSN